MKLLSMPLSIVAEFENKGSCVAERDSKLIFYKKGPHKSLIDIIELLCIPQKAEEN